MSNVFLSSITEPPVAGYWGSDKFLLSANVLCRVVRNGDVSKNGVVIVSELPLRWFSVSEIENARIIDGDLVLVSSGAYTGNVGRLFFDDGLDCVVVSNFVRRIRPRDLVLGGWLYHLMRSDVVQKNVWPHTGGSAIPNLNKSFYSGVSIDWLPPLQEQKRIAEILDTLDETIRKTEQLIEKLKQMKQGLLHDLLTRGLDENGALRPPPEDAPHLYQESPLGFIPKEWTVELLDDVSIRGSGHTPSKNVPAYWGGGVKWVSLADSGKLDNVYIFDTDKEISHLGVANSSAVIHPPGTVVLSRDAGVGKSAVLGESMAVSQHFMAWQCGHRLNSLFLYFYLQNSKVFFESIAFGSTIQTIGLPFFKRLKILVPPMREQELVVASVMACERNCNEEMTNLSKLRALKKGLMKDLLTGRVRVPTPAVEG